MSDLVKRRPVLPRRIWSLLVKRGRLFGIDRGWPLELRPSAYGLPCRIWRLLVQRYERTYGDTPGKTGPLASRLSRSLKVIGTDTDRSGAHDILLTFHSKHGLILYRFQDSEVLESPGRKKSLIFFSFLDTIHEYDGHTDIHTDRHTYRRLTTADG